MTDEKRYCQTCKDEELDEDEGLCRTCRDLVSEGLHPMHEDLTARGEVVMSNWRPKDKKPEPESTEQKLCGDCADYDLPASSAPCRPCHSTRDKPNWRMKAGLLEKLRGIIETRTAERNNWRERCMKANSNLASANKQLAQESKEVLKLKEEIHELEKREVSRWNELVTMTHERNSWRGQCEFFTDHEKKSPDYKRMEQELSIKTSELEVVNEMYKGLSEHYDNFRVGVTKQILGMEKDRFKNASKKELLEQLKIAETEHASFFSMMRFLITKEEKC